MSQTMELDPDDESEEAEDDEYSHLKDLSDGAGCTEIWEHLSDSREE